MNFEEYQDMNYQVKLILYLDIDVSTERFACILVTATYTNRACTSYAGLSKSSQNFVRAFAYISLPISPFMKNNLTLKRKHSTSK